MSTVAVMERGHGHPADVLAVPTNVTIAGGPLDRATLGVYCVRVPVAVSLLRGLAFSLQAVAECAIEQCFPSSSRAGLPERRGEVWVDADLSYEGPDPEARVLLVSIRRGDVIPSNWVTLTFSEWFRGVEHQSLLVREGAVEPWHEALTRVPSLECIGGRYLVIVEPAGTHGWRIGQLIAHYKQTGTPLGVVVLCAVVTPGFCEHLRTEHPDARIFALRLDRGVDANGFPSPGFVDAQYKLGVDPDLLREP